MVDCTPVQKVHLYVPEPSLTKGPGLKIVLLNLPWASFRRPSIQLGLLGELARKHGHHAELAHLNLDLAAEIGSATYDAVSEHRSVALGEWLFSEAAFGHDAPAAQPFLDCYGDAITRLLEQRHSPLLLEELALFRRRGAEQYLQRQIEQNDWSGTDVFGLSSTFQQNNACFAMARLLKDRFPRSHIVAGGANFDSVMGQEWLRNVPALDLIVSGEADIAFPLLLRALAEGRSLEGVPNLVLRASSVDSRCIGSIKQTLQAPPYRELDELPTPDYRDYFERAEALNLLERSARRNVDIPIETSRGCWWGERQHCTFCGLNGQTMEFRSKSAVRVANELATLSAKYHSYRFTAVDNILDLNFHKTLFPELLERGCTYDFFYEVKSGVSPKKLKEMHAVGIRRIQPGIESLSTNVLKLMNKGVSALANINLLRWSRTLGIDVSWNLIWGFPGETQDDYQLQLQWLGLLSHLQPPVGAGRIWLERFSPLYKQRASMTHAIQPELSLRHVYPAAVDLSRAAYFFEYDLPSEIDPSLWKATADFVEQWNAAHVGDQVPYLEYRYSPDFLQIDEARFGHEPGIYTFASPYAEIYMALTDTARPIDSLLDLAGVDRELLERSINEFCSAGLMLREGMMALALALPASKHERRSI